MKRVISVLLCLLIVFTLFGCKKSAEEGSASSETSDVVSMYDLSRAMLGAAKFGEMSYLSNTDDHAEDLFTYVSDLDYEKVEAFCLAYATNGKGCADEFCVIAVKDANDVAAAQASLQRHLEKRISQYATYDPLQSKKVEAGIVFSEGRYAVLIVSDDNNAVKEAFFDFIK